MFVPEIPGTANRIAGLAMGDDTVLAQPQAADGEVDDIEVPAFVRKHLSRSEDPA
jgi:hypothetical protein